MAGIAPPSPIRLLSLDGGGVKGISSLRILEAIMEEVHRIETATPIAGAPTDCTSRDAKRLPVEYFDLAAGTSVGGINGIMLFRLRMNASEACEAFHRMAKQIFAPTVFGFKIHSIPLLGRWIANPALKIKALLTPAAFSGTPLENAINTVVTNRINTLGEAAPPTGPPRLLRDGGGKLIVCATLAEKGESIRFRSYTTTQFESPIRGQIGETDHATLAQMKDVSILTAATATSAAPTFLPPVQWQGLKLWDGGLLNNNPVHQLWRARSDLVQNNQPDAEVACVVSIGTGYQNDSVPLYQRMFRIFDTAIRSFKFVTNTEAVHKDFKNYIDRLRLRQAAQGLVTTEYFRFDVPTGDKRFDLDDYQQMRALETLTQEYITANAAEITRCANILAQKGVYHCVPGTH